MRRSGLSSVVVILGLLPAPSVSQQTKVVREGNRFARDFYGNAPPARRLRVNAHGPVTVQAGASPNLQYIVRLSVQARTEREAISVLQHYSIRQEMRGDMLVLTAPGGPVISTFSVKAPRLDHVVVSTSDGAVEASGIDGPLEVDTGAGEIGADRIRGDCRLITGGGDIRIGKIGGSLQCSSGAGKIHVVSVQGTAVMETVGGDITVGDVGGGLRAETGGGGIHVSNAGGAVSVSTGGGQILVDRAKGIVTARNLAGPVKVGAAGGVQCESASGGINVSNITGAMNVSTSLGNIIASLLSGRLTESYLATANGDITVLIPSNVGVNIRAQNDMADSTRRIAVDFPGVRVRRQGRLIVAEGPVNGGGPLLQISATVGTIFIRKQ